VTAARALQGDTRSFQMALVAESELDRLLDLLEEERFGAVQLPPDGLDGETVALWLEQIAEHVAEFRRNDYVVVLLDDGAYADQLGRAFSGLGVGPLPRLRVPAEEDEVRSFLREQSVPALK
jgi:hypothetical protein